jgi:hypothetical protein
MYHVSISIILLLFHKNCKPEGVSSLFESRTHKIRRFCWKNFDLVSYQSVVTSILSLTTNPRDSVDTLKTAPLKINPWNPRHTPLENSVTSYSGSSIRKTQVQFLTSIFNYFTFLAWYFEVSSAVWRLDSTRASQHCGYHISALADKDP